MALGSQQPQGRQQLRAGSSPGLALDRAGGNIGVVAGDAAGGTREHFFKTMPFQQAACGCVCAATDARTAVGSAGGVRSRQPGTHHTVHCVAPTCSSVSEPMGQATQV